MGASRGKLVVYAIIMAVLLYGLLRIFIDRVGLFIRLELIGFLFLCLLIFIGFVGYSKRWGENVFFSVFILYILNLILVWLTGGALYIFLLILALVGFFMSIPRRIPERADDSPIVAEPHSEVFDVPTQVETASETQSVRKKHSPGKYVASISSNVYHEPKCDWAKRIHKERRVWFDTMEDAWEKGYKAHECAK